MLKTKEASNELFQSIANPSASYFGNSKNLEESLISDQKLQKQTESPVSENPFVEQRPKLDIKEEIDEEEEEIKEKQKEIEEKEILSEKEKEKLLEDEIMDDNDEKIEKFDKILQENAAEITQENENEKPKKDFQLEYGTRAINDTNLEILEEKEQQEIENAPEYQKEKEIQSISVNLLEKSQIKQQSDVETLLEKELRLENDKLKQKLKDLNIDYENALKIASESQKTVSDFQKKNQKLNQDNENLEKDKKKLSAELQQLLQQLSQLQQLNNELKSAKNPRGILEEKKEISVQNPTENPTEPTSTSIIPGSNAVDQYFKIENGDKEQLYSLTTLIVISLLFFLAGYLL